MKLKNKFAALLVASGSLVAASSAQAASYAAGDLMLYFFQEGGTQTVYVNLGQAYTYRGATAGPQEAINNPNLQLAAKGELSALNLGTTLNTAFNTADWTSLTNLYAGLAGAFSTSTATTSTAIQNGDPHRTIYFSVPNNLSDVASGRTFAAAGTLTTIAQRIQGMSVGFSGNDSVKTVATSATTIDEQNPVSGGLLAMSLGGFSGGNAQVGTSGTLGSLGSVNNVEFALDLHRILATTNPTGTINGVDENGSAIPALKSMYEGTVTISSDGTVGFSAVPEPSSVMLLGLGAGALAFRRRRNA
jgi:hypothetical protein